MYDLIGDILDHAQELKALLRRLGYELAGDGWAHREKGD